MLLMAMSRVMGSAAKIAPGLKIVPVRRRHSTSPNRFEPGRAAGRNRVGRGCVDSCLFMMDVRILLLIIGFGRKALALE